MPYSQEPLAKLGGLLALYFSEPELHTLCQDVGEDYENVPAKGQGKENYAHELVRHLNRRDKILVLLEVMKCKRPNLVAQIESIEAELTSVQSQQPATFPSRERQHRWTKAALLAAILLVVILVSVILWKFVADPTGKGVVPPAATPLNPPYQDAFIKLKSVNPDPQMTLTAGSHISFSVSIEYYIPQYDWQGAGWEPHILLDSIFSETQGLRVANLKQLVAEIGTTQSAVINETFTVPNDRSLWFVRLQIMYLRVGKLEAHEVSSQIIYLRYRINPNHQ